jgi:hypothetical protein
MIKRKFQTMRRIKQTFGLLEIVKLLLRKGRISRGYQEDHFPNGLQWTDSIFLAERNIFENYSGVSNLDLSRSGFFGEVYDLGSELGSHLIRYIRTFTPSLIIETGVAAGKSTSIILSELENVGRGNLFSFDVTSQVGELVSSKLQHRWKLIVLPKLFRKKYFIKSLHSMTSAKLFLHDSDHSGRWQLFEVKSAISYLHHLDMILIDDVQPETVFWLQENFEDKDLIFLDEKGVKRSLVVNLLD